ncbi:MAPEG family protein [Ferrimonas lipolytica]|uniref:MAPEG family protein n=1 Tax=Ferrimonas lipolytica TaxID=2724191 RepID=A0A6H1UCY7_9GAMM|nr:MAPEG family protein [Ferrimonas lipolytica]QIZ76967.1 MAPEG family protein [Ferrimonas lipolytica]
MSLPITAITVSITALIALSLALLSVTARRKCKVAIGTGQDQELLARTRSHANLIEYAVFILPMLAVAELYQAPQWLLCSVAIAWVVARVLHPWGLIATAGGLHFGRMVGTLLTWIVTIVLAILNIVLVLQA